MNAHTVRFTVAGFCSALFVAVPARGQSAVPQPGPACTYLTCALRMDGSKLVRGAAGEVVARPLFMGIPLARFVSGDSASEHARRYQRDVKRSTVLNVVGGVAFATGYFVALHNERHCEPLVPRNCEGQNSGYKAGMGLMFGGALASLGSTPFTIRSFRSRDRAIWWHNSQFAR